MYIHIYIHTHIHIYIYTYALTINSLIVDTVVKQHCHEDFRPGTLRDKSGSF